MEKSQMSMQIAPSKTRRRDPVELEIALVIIIVLSGVYIAYDLIGEPRGGHPFGNWLGIIGTFLMLMTETLYSLRKRTRLLNRFGPMRGWLSFHIVTGIVGPFLVLMHTGLQFRGLAGVTMALTVLMVVSGFIGRYLYTSLQRSRQTGINQRKQLEQEHVNLQAGLEQFEREKPARLRQIAADLKAQHGDSRWANWRYRRRLRREFSRVEREATTLRHELSQNERGQAKLDRRIDTVDRTQSWFRLWHMLHVPLGLALFTSVALHIAAAIYFRAGVF
jgi:cell division protein FtsL